MNRKILTGMRGSAAVAVVFTAGFLVGRHSLETSVYDAPLSAAEGALLGNWQISANVEPMQSTIEFRDDRTAVKCIERGKVGMVATWGRIGDEVSIQHAHAPGERGDYVPPAIFKVLNVDDEQIHLATWDGTVTWKLTRL